MWGRERVQMQHKPQRRPTVVLLFALVGMLFAACSGPSLGDASNAAIIGNKAISTSQFLAVTKLLEGVANVQDSSLPSWQLLRGRVAHQKAQQQALNLLATNMVIDQNAKGLLTPEAWARVKTLEDAQVQSDFKQLTGTSPYKPLVDQGILTPDTYRPFVHQQIVEQQFLDPKNLKGGDLRVDLAHVKIITVKTKAQANTILAALKSGGDWASLATKNSLDSAQASGGDIVAVPPGYLPAEVDGVVFGKGSIPVNTTVEVAKASRLGYSIVQVVSRNTGIFLSTLDSTQPIVTNARTSLQGAAINGLITQWSRAAHAQVNVNWCGNTGGVSCGPVLTLDQQA